MRTRIATVALAAVMGLPAVAWAQQQQPQAQQQQQPQAQQQQQPEMQEAGPRLLVTSDTVSQVQLALERLGYDPGPIDGIWGPLTRQTVTAFQRDRGLETTGMLNLATLEAMGFERLAVARQMQAITPGQPGQQFAAVPQAAQPAQQGLRPQDLGPAATQLIQRRLNRRDMDIATDGRWGEETDLALRLLPITRDLPATGRLDAATLEALGLDREDLAEAETFPGIGEAPE